MDIRRRIMQCSSQDSDSGPVNEIIATYNVTTTSSETQLISTLNAGTVLEYDYPEWDLSQVKTMFIDDVEYTPKKSHKFSTTGTHTVKIHFNDTFTSMGMMFSQCTALKSIDFTNCDLSNVTNMGGIFGDCASLTSVNFEGVDTSNAVTMMGMFDTCTALTTVDLSPLNTSKVTEFAYMFNGCTSLTSIDMSMLDTSSLKDLYKTFCGCTNLLTADLSGFITTKVTDFSYMFQGCTKITTIDMRNIGSANITSTSSYGYMFAGCKALTTLYWGMKTAPSVYSNTFGSSNSSNNTNVYAGYTNRSKGTNKLYLPSGHSGYTSYSISNYWRNRLCSTSYCGFSITTF